MQNKNLIRRNEAVKRIKAKTSRACKNQHLSEDTMAKDVSLIIKGSVSQEPQRNADHVVINPVYNVFSSSSVESESNEYHLSQVQNSVSSLQSQERHSSKRVK